MVAAVAALADGTTHLHGIAHIRGHETDRLAALAAELERLGGHVHETHDGLTIHPRLLGGAEWQTYADHRMAQAGALLGLVVPEVNLDDIGCTAKTMPEFADLWQAMIDGSPRSDAGEAPIVSLARATSTRPSTAPAAAADPGPRTGPPTPTPSRAWWSPSTAAASPPWSTDREVSAAKARQLGRTGVIVGDRVSLVGDTSGEEGTLARIVEVAERETVLRRTADDDDPYERPIVANADQLVIVTALADPPPRTGMIDRILVAGFDAGIAPLLCLTKADLAAPMSWSPVRAARRAGRRSPRPAPTWTRCGRPSTATAASSSGTPASASRPWSTP